MKTPMKETFDVDLSGWFAKMTPDKFSSFCERDGKFSDADREEIRELTGTLLPKGTVMLVSREGVDDLIEKIKRER
jgi:hypothetical protein